MPSLPAKSVPWVVAVLALAAPALAQLGPIPPTDLPPPDVAGPPADSAAPPPSDVAPPAPPSVQVAPLPTLDLFSAGRDTGLGSDLWRGSSADIARAVIPTLAQTPLSPASAALARRVLATAASAPVGAGTDLGLAAARAKALLALGDAADADAILDRTQGAAGSAELSQIAAEAALITDQPDKACRIGEALAVGRGDLYWLRLRAFCEARAGRMDAAQLTFSLAQQQGADRIYARLMGPVLTGSGDPGPASLRNGLDYALSRQSKLDLGPAVADAPPAIADRIPPAPPPSMAPPPAQPPGAPPPPPPPPPAETDVLAALAAPKTTAGYVAAAKAQQPAIAALVALKAPLTDPVRLATAALAAGDLPDAQAIRTGLTGDSVPNAGPVDLAILDAALAAASGKPDEPTLDRLCERGVEGDAKARSRAQAAAAIFAGLGAPLTALARGELVGFDLGAGHASPAQLLVLDAAADAGVKGDTALVALAIAEAGGEAGPPPADRARMVRALVRAGLQGDAQALAVEGLIELRAR